MKIAKKMILVNLGILLFIVLALFLAVSVDTKLNPEFESMLAKEFPSTAEGQALYEQLDKSKACWGSEFTPEVESTMDQLVMGARLAPPPNQYLDFLITRCLSLFLIKTTRLGFQEKLRKEFEKDFKSTEIKLNNYLNLVIKEANDPRDIINFRTGLGTSHYALEFVQEIKKDYPQLQLPSLQEFENFVQKNYLPLLREAEHKSLAKHYKYLRQISNETTSAEASQTSLWEKLREFFLLKSLPINRTFNQNFESSQRTLQLIEACKEETACIEKIPTQKNSWDFLANPVGRSLFPIDTEIERLTKSFLNYQLTHSYLQKTLQQMQTQSVGTD